MQRTPRHLRLCLAFLAWFAQLCLPLAHAATMAAAPAQMAGWCGDPARAQAFIAGLPAELRAAFEPDATNAQLLDACAEMCVVATTPPPLPTPGVTVAPGTATQALASVVRPAPVALKPAPKPPSHGPPLRV